MDAESAANRSNLALAFAVIQTRLNSADMTDLRKARAKLGFDTLINEHPLVRDEAARVSEHKITLARKLAESGAHSSSPHETKVLEGCCARYLASRKQLEQNRTEVRPHVVHAREAVLAEVSEARDAVAAPFARLASGSMRRRIAEREAGKLIWRLRMAADIRHDGGLSDVAPELAQLLDNSPVLWGDLMTHDLAASPGMRAQVEAYLQPHAAALQAHADRWLHGPAPQPPEMQPEQQAAAGAAPALQ